MRSRDVAASPAAHGSSRSRSSNSSASCSLSINGVTAYPREATRTTSSSPSSRFSASRTGVWETPSRCASPLMEIRAPGSSWCSRMRVRRAW